MPPNEPGMIVNWIRWKTTKAAMMTPPQRMVRAEYVWATRLLLTYLSPRFLIVSRESVAA